VGGLLCLDFINTVTWRGDPAAGGERLRDYDELVHWAVHAESLGRSQAKRLLREAERRPEAARAVLARAVELREAVARLIFSKGAADDVAVVNRALAAAPARTAIRPQGKRYAWRDAAREDELDAPLHSVTFSAVDLLTSDQLARVRRCGDARCAWVFLDASPTGRRRWCSMADCGNRAKVRRHYRRAAQS
jgi:predicted RNA-binding Zn ribbon-like protein